MEFGAWNAAAQHIESDGLHQSPYFDFRTNISDLGSPHLVWMADTGTSTTRVSEFRKWCREFGKRVQVAMDRRRALGLSTTWPIFIMDWSDIPINGTCENLEKLMGIDSIFYSKRSIVKQRFWRGRRGWVSVGMQIARRGENRFYHHTPMTVRTDTVQCLQDVLRENYNLTVQDAIEDLVPRPVDVSHFWPSNLKGVGTIESKLRTKVSLILEAMVNETSSSSSSSKLNAFVGLAGATKRSGRKSVKNV